MGRLWCSYMILRNPIRNHVAKYFWLLYWAPDSKPRSLPPPPPQHHGCTGLALMTSMDMSSLKQSAGLGDLDCDLAFRWCMSGSHKKRPELALRSLAWIFTTDTLQPDDVTPIVPSLRVWESYGDEHFRGGPGLAANTGA